MLFNITLHPCLLSFLLTTERLNEFSIYGSNKSFNPYGDDDKQLCTCFHGQFGNAATRTFTCESQ